MKEEEIDPRMERIIRYEEGEMDAAERGAFEADLAADPVLRADLEAARRTIGGLRTLGEERLREELRSADKEDAARTVSGIARWWWAAAAIIALGGLLWWLMPSRTTPQQLADEFMLAEPGLPVLMGTSPRAMDAIMNAYKQEDPGTAQRLLKAALEDDAGNDTLRYFRGVVEGRLTGCAAAEMWFAQVSDASAFAAKARYNEALCAIRSGDLSRARELLGKLDGMGDAQVAARARDLLLRLANR